jgi:glycosyltransferase involved in cell wall biosynthesis
LGNADPLATIIVTPRERFAVARRALESVASNTPNAHRLIYVVGGASPDVQRYLEETCAARGYDLIIRPEFLAPNAARNIGLALANTKYVVFLDNDVVVEPGWLKALVDCAQEEDADIVSPLCLIGEPSDRELHTIGGRLIVENHNEKLSIHERHHSGPICLRDNPQRLRRQPSDYSEFHCALVRRAIFDRIGPLDEQITGAAEHVDLALHLRQLGSRGFVEPSAIVSYLPTAYTVGDLDTYGRRWSEEWYFATMDHLVSKWNLSEQSPLLRDYLSSFYELRERCLLRHDVPSLPSPADPERLRVAQTIVQLLDQMQSLSYPQEAMLKVRDAYMVATELFATNFRASGRSLLAHVVGTSSILATVGASPAVVAAAALHAAFSHANHGNNVAAMRRWLQRRVGESVEKLIYVQSTLQFDEAVKYCPQNVDSMPIELANAIIIRIANGLEDRLSRDYHYFDSAAWLKESNALIDRWLPVFDAVADKLDFGHLTSMLRTMGASAEPDTRSSPLRPSRLLNYTIEPTVGAENPHIYAISHNDRNSGSPHAGAAKVSELRTKPPFENSQNKTDIEPSRIKALNKGRVTVSADLVAIVTDPAVWAYSAYFDLQQLASKSGQAAAEIRLQVDRGKLGILVLERGSSVYQVVPEQSVEAQEEIVTVRFEIPSVSEVGNVVFRGWPTKDGQTETHARILAMTLFN